MRDSSECQIFRLMKTLLNSRLKTLLNENSPQCLKVEQGHQWKLSSILNENSPQMVEQGHQWKLSSMKTLLKVEQCLNQENFEESCGRKDWKRGIQRMKSWKKTRKKPWKKDEK